MFPRQGTPLLEVKICKQMNQKLFLTGGFSGGTSGKESTCPDVRDADCMPGLGRSPGEGNGNPLQCFCLGNP